MSAYLPEFIDPISGELMRDPVIGSDGHTYERSSIEEWLQRSHTSPMTRQPMTSLQLTPNYALKSIIDQYLHPHVTPAIKQPISAEPDLQTPDLDVSLTACTFQHENYVHIKVSPPAQTKKRFPVGIVAAVDVSGSMGEEASVRNDTVEISGFSRLDLVKHSLNTTISSLSDDDVLCLVAFTSDATMVLNPTKMDKYGKLTAMQAVKDLKPLYNTNLWSGLRMALEATKDPLFEKVLTNVLVLTDGESNQDPPRGILPTFEQYLHSHKCSINVHTFGYGYSLDYVLLNKISSLSHGTYAFIPDCTMVGTIFINFLSYILSTVSMNNMLTIIPHADTKVSRVIGYPGGEQLSAVNIGNIQYGQSRDILVKVDHGCHLEVRVTCSNNKSFTSTISALSDDAADVATPMASELARLLTVEILQQYQYRRVEALHALDEHIILLQSFPKTPNIVSLLVDLHSDDPNEGQVYKAFEKEEWYQKWGKFYIPSVLGANLLQFCNNFKDKSVQLFGGELFRLVQDFANDIFCNLPPPTPSITQYSSNNGNSNSVAQSMAYLNSASIGCFDGDGEVLTANGAVKVKDISAGDTVVTKEGNAKVLCVVKSKVLNGKCSLVNVKNVLLTPWHPVLYQGKWSFPSELRECSSQVHSCEFVYDFVLDKGHVITINGLDVCTFGHGLTGAVIGHPYFGTSKVVNDLKATKGWALGSVTIGSESKFSYDPNTLMVNGWKIEEL